LEQFFDQGGVLEGAHLDQRGNLVLYAKRGPAPTLVGVKVSLSDFVVAYRAVFHAGDNEAFVSLDTHPDPTKVKANFGGLLEDTRIGQVVLASDERFKTITTGLDPHSAHDLRATIRKSIPPFMACVERDLASPERVSGRRWIGTRFWYYPESIEVESDQAFEYCRIATSQFTAAAERSRQDFRSLAEFEQLKKVSLNPSIKANIDHLNQSYEEFARVFPELSELRTVARLLGVCSWLKKAKEQRADLDSLLSVELPPCKTAKERSRFFVCGAVAYMKGDLGTDDVMQDATIKWLTPRLDDYCKDLFSDAEEFAKFVSYQEQEKRASGSTWLADPNMQFEHVKDLRARELIRSSDDLKAFVLYISQETVPRMAHAIVQMKEELAEKQTELSSVQAELGRLDKRMKTNAETHNALLPKYKSLVDRHNQLGNALSLDAQIKALKASDLVVSRTMRITGGIDLGPDRFSVKTGAPSPGLKRFISNTKKARLMWDPDSKKVSLVKSRFSEHGDHNGTRIPQLRWTIKKTNVATQPQSAAVCDGPQRRWLQRTSGTKSWRDQTKVSVSVYCERRFDDTAKVLQIATHRSGKLTSDLVGRMKGENTIVFTRSSDQKLIQPQEPPIWWKN